MDEKLILSLAVLAIGLALTYGQLPMYGPPNVYGPQAEYGPGWDYRMSTCPPRTLEIQTNKPTETPSPVEQTTGPANPLKVLKKEYKTL